jgi:hypothetical protein
MLGQTWVYERDDDVIDTWLKVFGKCSSKVEDEMPIVLQHKLGIKAVKI